MRHSVGELAGAASVSASTTSAPLAKLQHAGLIGAEARGRHRYFRLADAEVAHLLAALALVAERGSHERFWSCAGRAPPCHARCCYGHLAGRVGVALLRGLQAQACLQAQADNGFQLSDKGRAWLTHIGLPEPKVRPPQRLAYACLDWSERRDHLAGVLPAALLKHFLARAWLVPGSTDAEQRNRALRLTPTGQQALGGLLRL